MTRDQLRHLGLALRKTIFYMLCMAFVIVMSATDENIKLLQDWMK